MPLGGPGQTPGASGPRPRSRHRKPAPARRALLPRKQRMAAALIATVGVIVGGFFTGFGEQDSAEPTVQAFLLDWQQGNFKQAAAFTTGSHTAVAAQLASAYTDLNATAMFLALGPVTQHGNTAEAAFKATVDVDQGRHQWMYNGRLGLVWRHGVWFVNWSPSVINPSLGPGDRLAVVASYPPRGQVTDASGKPLLPQMVDYQFGVYPGRLASPSKTAAEFSGIAQLDAKQVLGEIRAAPPGAFLPLLTVNHPTASALWPRLATVPGVSFQRKTERLFTTDTDGSETVTGGVGTENSGALRAAGVAYEPGNTIGLSGLEQAYQESLAGTPSASVVVVGPDGQEAATLWTDQGRPGNPVQTTLDSRDQQAAARVLSGRRGSGEIIAVDSATGDIRAAATHNGGVPLPPGGPLNGRIAPGMAFSIVSAAAMVSAGVQPGTPLPCVNSEAIGGQTFTYTGQRPSATFASDFANGCGTAFASSSSKLTPAGLAATEKAFGIGADWDLPLRAFPGSVQSASPGASLAAQATGTGGVRMSPLGMALVAAEVDAGTGHEPVLVQPGPAVQPASQRQVPLSGPQLAELRQMMRDAVRSGSARAANVPGAAVYGQAGVVRTGQDAWLSWFVGYQGSTAVAVLQAGNTPQQAAAALAGSFLASVRR